MPVIGRGDEHRVDVRPVDYLPVIERAIAFVLFGIDPGALAVNIADGQDLAAVVALADAAELVDEVGAAAPHADGADINAVIGADYTARFSRASSQRSARHSQRCADLGCMLYELPSINGVVVHAETFLRASFGERLNKLYTRWVTNVNTGGCQGSTGKDYAALAR